MRNEIEIIPKLNSFFFYIPNMFMNLQLKLEKNFIITKKNC